MFNNFINSCSILILIFTDIFLSVYGADVTPAQALKFVNSKMIKSNQVNKKPHINTMSKKSVNVYQVKSGIYAYASGLAVDTDGSDSDPDPEHQDETAWKDSNGKSLGAHRVPYYVLGDKCHEKTKPCPYFFYKEHNIAGLQFALFFYRGKAIGAVFGDTQGDSKTDTSNNDSRELGEASVKTAQLLQINSSGKDGGVDSGVTVVIFSGNNWVVRGTNDNLNSKAQSLVKKALNLLK